ncbi:tRNA (guanine-N(7)-)-methyltransferase non-catalytic subunit WDR4 isoform X2 [Eublepharis macularius]|uniref:tRNA (Guanine-N(7)-)-methyltransferase non-catalytic subunit WDR4 isoform X2 n=1 Tax=Eublepharis macularius TaxID=481883 RepID=A0AA97KTH9_EUBMA|nr:tRNA (guanine-N(7)-)-methyltransferase non-catalytic subunit WDR4 isoform X2 [Eublepharis macularius]
MEAAEAPAVASSRPGLGLCGTWMVARGGSKLLAASYKEPSQDYLFMYDCVTAGKKPQENKREDGKSTGKSSDAILAWAFSSSGTYVALTDDSKRLILFRTKPSWECLSISWILSREKHRAFPAFGDEPENAGTIELGHLSLLLDVALSPDDQYILTADRDEKIRVSLTRAPHNIVSFCLGHREFVSQIFVIPNYPDLLLSASGDCTLRLWEYKSGKEVHCCHLNSLNTCEATKNEKKYAVSRTAYCCEGNYIAILYDCIPTVSIFQLDTDAQKLLCKQHISLSHQGWDITFEETGGLWILQEDKQTPLLLYQPVDEQWQPVTEEKELIKMSKYLRDNWTVFEDSVGKGSCYQNLYKASFDNMAVYLQKKEERLQQQKNKRKELQHESNGQTKKVKTEAPSL